MARTFSDSYYYDTLFENDLDIMCESDTDKLKQELFRARTAIERLQNALNHEQAERHIEQMNELYRYDELLKMAKGKSDAELAAGVIEFVNRQNDRWGRKVKG